MILKEPIIKVLNLQYNDKYNKDWQNAYVHTTGAFEYHVTEGYWILVETENYYATIGYDGVKVYEKPYEFSEEKFDWWYDGDEDYIDWLDTLFCGQKIHSIEEDGDHRVIYFDSFNLHLYVYTEETGFNLDRGSFGDGENVMAVGRHLLKKCECGGNGELLCDERGDFAVRCQDCHRATYFDMVLKDRIDLWNEGDTPCTIDTGREMVNNILRSKKEIKQFAISTGMGQCENMDDISCDCDSIMLAIEDSYFLLSSQKIEGYNYDFTGHKVSNYNPDFWGRIIKPIDKLVFVREEQDFEGRRSLIFKLDDVELIVEATHWGLFVSLDEAQLHLNYHSLNRKKLFI